MIRFGVGASVALHILTVFILSFMAVFYFWPDRIVFGLPLSIALAGAVALYNFASPYISRILGWRDYYLSSIVRWTGWVFAGSVLLFIVTACWVGLMFGTIVDRYRYLHAMDDAISVVSSGQLALPAPEALARAFTIMPQRPEVLFILMRAARLLTFDDRPQNYYAYMQRFMLHIKKDEIAQRFKDFKRPTKVPIAEETAPVPLFDPIQTLSNFAIDDREQPKQGLKWAIDALINYRNTGAHAEMLLWRVILETEEALEGQTDKDAIERIRLRGIAEIEARLNPTSSGDFSALSFAADYVYQEALDYLAWLYAEGPQADARLTLSCAAADQAKVASLFQRILLLRTQLQTKSELIWWRSPGKLNVYLLFRHISGQKGTVSTKVYDTFNLCPDRMKTIKQLYESAAFKQFQDPETWMNSTPFSSALNGSATVALLRYWTRHGW